jgi:hypothetical protein
VKEGLESGKTLENTYFHRLKSRKLLAVFDLFVQVIRLYFYPVDMRSKYIMVKPGWAKYS